MLLKKRVPAARATAPAAKPAPPAAKKAAPFTRTAPSGTFKVDAEKILELINRRQRQVIVNSVIYYRIDTNIIPDSKWNDWARELVELQSKYPEIAAKSVFWEDMQDFDGSTGYHLANHVWGTNVALRLINNQKYYRKGGFS